MSIFKRLKLLWLLNKKLKDVNYLWRFTQFSRAPWKPDIVVEETCESTNNDPEEVKVWHVPIYPKKLFFTPLNMLRNWKSDGVEFTVWIGDAVAFTTYRKFIMWPSQYEWVEMTFITHLVYKILYFFNVALNICFPFLIKLSIYNEILDYCLKNMDTKYCLHYMRARENEFAAVAKFLPSCDSPEELELKLSVMI